MSSTIDEFQKRISKLEAEMAEVKAKLEEVLHIREKLVDLPVVIPTEEAVTRAVEEAHVEVKPAEEEATEEEPKEKPPEEETSKDV